MTRRRIQHRPDAEAEGANLDRLRHNFAENPRVRVPRMFWKDSNRTTLVTELIAGRPLEKVPRADRRQLAEILARAAFQQFFVDGFFMADPQPENFAARSGPVLVILEAGRMEYVPRAARFDLANFSMALRAIKSLVKKLAPRFDFDAALQTARAEAQRDANSPRRIARDLQAEIFDNARFVPFKNVLRELDHENDERVLAFMAVTLFIGSAAILSSPVLTASGLLLGRIGLALTAVLFVWLIKQVAYKPA